MKVVYVSIMYYGTSTHDAIINYLLVSYESSVLQNIGTFVFACTESLLMSNIY
jgi:DNA-directed RNA polymerase subunit E'/Rpb7